MNKWFAIVLLALSVLTSAMGLKALNTHVLTANTSSPVPRIAASTPANTSSPVPR